MTTKRTDPGFTLVETLIAIVILVVGLAGVSNLLLVASRSRFVANATTVAVSQGSEVMERLKAIPFTTLVAGGALTSDQGSISGCNDATQSGGCVVAGNFNARRDVPGAGVIRTRWTITAFDTQTLFISVLSETTSPLAGGNARAQFTTFRACTSAALGC